MMKDLSHVTIDETKRPKGPMLVVYFSSISNNTHRFIQKLGIDNKRIPTELTDAPLIVDQDYVLITPTYAGGGEFKNGAVPKQVINFLNNPQNRSFCKAVIASGNTNFGDTFALAGPIISKKLNIPLLYQFELLGTADDTAQISKILNDFWIK
ncbi:class Ib ribonucleoside-diphosphate reductase assembly flavoprotein NrdI [Mycoplasmopsis agassizii]|uniref:class Ib ribonucleoside-diphosphate reductase assembly flavoprotein NrdI n=1 Tax=Mycoplasmopsis agassizii TaxID=33922 RepID=UPI0035289957